MAEAVPVRVALMNDYEVVVSGLRSMLAPYADRLLVVELDSQLPVLREDVDVLLYDAYSGERITGPVRRGAPGDPGAGGAVQLAPRPGGGP